MYFSTIVLMYFSIIAGLLLNCDLFLMIMTQIEVSTCTVIYFKELSFLHSNFCAQLIDG